MENELETLPEFPLEPLNEKPTLSWAKHLLVFVIGFLAMNLLAPLVNELFQPIGTSGNEALMETLLSFIVYVLLFVFLSAILWLFNAFSDLFRDFRHLTPYLKGVFYGFIIIVASVSYNVFAMLIVGPQDSNQNQQAIEGVIKAYPFLNFFWIVLLGPLVEEFMYRFGLFNGLAKVNRLLAYVVSGLIFGFIHFTIPYDANGGIDQALLVVELINIPSYIISGLLFAYIYEKEGFATSATAHITNNLVSFITTIIFAYA